MSQGQPKHTNAYKIFHYTLRIRIPASYGFEKYHQLCGVPEYENQDQYTQAAEEMVLFEMPLSDAIEYYHRGAKVEFEDPNQSVQAYQWLKDYLNEQHYRVQHHVNARKIALSDLKKMDEFAEVLYRIARNYEPVDSRESSFDRSIETLFSKRLLRRRHVDPRREDPPPQEDQHGAKEHRSVTDDITKEAINRHLDYE